eukprot:SM000045S16294  [mRNA]  locus=s45:718132:719909:+ [translate_table: standard]
MAAATVTAAAAPAPAPAAGKVVVVTGVTKGLGEALALELASRGHTVAGCGRSEDKLEKLRSRLQGKHLFKAADVTSDKSVGEFCQAVIDTLGIPDIVINNAGCINANAKLWDVPIEEFHSVIDTNVKGTYHVIRHFVPYLVSKKGSVIVNLSSGWGRSTAAEASALAESLHPLVLANLSAAWSSILCPLLASVTVEGWDAQVAPYCATKWAVEGMTKALAKELPPGVVAVALNPGIINTAMLQSCFGSSASMYTTPDQWAPHAANLILGISPLDNGASMTV